MITAEKVAHFKSNVAKYFSHSYRSISEYQLQLYIEQALRKVVKALLEKEQLFYSLCRFILLLYSGRSIRYGSPIQV